MKLDPTLVGDRPLSAVSVAAHATARGASAVDVGDDVDKHRPLRRERLRDRAADLARLLHPGCRARPTEKTACLTRDASNRLGVCWDWLDGDGNGVTTKPGAAPAAGRPLHCGISVPSMSALGHSRPVEGPPVAGACPLRSESGHALASLDMSAKCQSRSRAPPQRRLRRWCGVAVMRTAWALVARRRIIA